jgi:hypothetical protein
MAIALAVAVGILLVALTVLLLTSARAAKAEIRGAARETLEMVFDFVLRLAGRRPPARTRQP